MSELYDVSPREGLDPDCPGLERSRQLWRWFYAPDVWHVPEGVTSAWVALVGGTSSDGRGGQYLAKVVDLTPLAAIAVNVGRGGVAVVQWEQPA